MRDMSLRSVVHLTLIFRQQMEFVTEGHASLVAIGFLDHLDVLDNRGFSGNR